jgi:hypothetical protein
MAPGDTEIQGYRDTGSKETAGQGVRESEAGRQRVKETASYRSGVSGRPI